MIVVEEIKIFRHKAFYSLHLPFNFQSGEWIWFPLDLQPNLELGLMIHFKYLLKSSSSYFVEAPGIGASIVLQRVYININSEQCFHGDCRTIYMHELSNFVHR